MRVGRRHALGLGVAATALVVIVAVGLTVLPEVVRRMVVSRVTELTRRPVTLADVDLNLFTGHVALKGFRLPQRDSSQDALAFERLDVRVAYLPLFTRHVRLREIRLTAPRVHVVRTGPDRFDFDDLLALVPPPGAPPSRWTVAIDGLALERGTIVARDLAVSPPAEWRLADLTFSAAGLTTRANARPGRASLSAGVNDATVRIEAKTLSLASGAMTAAIGLDGFRLALASPYFPAGVLIAVQTGTGHLALDVQIGRDESGAPRITVGGEAAVDELTIVRRDAKVPFVTLRHAGLTIARADLTRRAIALGAIELKGAEIELARRKDGVVDVLTLMPPAAGTAAAAPSAATGPDVAAPPGAPTVSLDRLDIGDATVHFRDDGVTPAADWRVANLALHAEKLSTAPGAPPATYTVGGELNGARLAVADGTLRLEPLTVGGRVSVDAIDLAWIHPYLGDGLPVAPPTGRARATLTFSVTPNPTLAGRLGGDVRVDGLRVALRGAPAPLATLAAARVGLTSVDLATRDVRVGAVEVDGLQVNAARGRDGLIDVLQAFAPSAPPAGATPPRVAGTASGSPATAAVTLTLDRVTVRGSAFTFTDEAVTPTTTLPVRDVALSVRSFTWPATRPALLETTMTLPGGARFALKGRARLTPFEADVETSLRDGTPEPFLVYLPFRARIGGRFHGDNRARLTATPAGIVVTSVGRSWAEAIAVREPDAPPGQAPPIRIGRMSLDGIEFDWPTRARVARVTVGRPDIRLSRSRAGGIDLATLFAYQPVPSAAPAATQPATTGAAPSSPGDGRPAPPRSPSAQPRDTPAAASTPHGTGPAPPASPFAVDVDAFVIEDGFVRFADHATEPAFAESISKLGITLAGLSNTPGRVARLAVDATVGDARFEARGEFAPLAAEPSADVSVTLTDYALARVNPYVEQAIAWVIDRGTISAAVRARVARGALDVRNDIDVRRLRVAKAAGHDTTKQRVSLPLGLIVKLITDKDDGFKTTIPISGRLDDPEFAWSDAIWTAVKNVLLNVAAAPFRAIGRLLTGPDDTVQSVAVEPARFAPASAAVEPDTERHLLRVADFLRSAPQVSLELTSVVSAADMDGLRRAALTSRVESLRKSARLPSWPAAVAAEYARRFPGVPPPATVEEQLARLLEVEPRPDDAVAHLGAARLSAVREALTKTEGVDPARVVAREVSAEAEGHGRVEFRLPP